MITQATTDAPTTRCAIYTRKSTEEGLEQEFNSLDAQREAGEAYVKSQASEGWECLPDRYDDGGFSGGNMERPALQRLLADVEAGKIDCIVVYKVDRLSRSLLDFAKMVETFDRHAVSFVSVTQLINTSTSMGRLMLNVLLSFAQFEREIISERTRDKIAATRRKGKWSGGRPILGYRVVESKLVVDPAEAERVRRIFALYLERDGLVPVVEELARRGWTNKQWTTKKGDVAGGKPFDKNSLWGLLRNVTVTGRVRYKDEVHAGEHAAIIDDDTWRLVQSKLKRNGRNGGSAVRNRQGALLKGLLFCAPCGRAMTATYSTRGAKRYRYYVCNGAQKNGRTSCPSRSIPAGEIERFVVEQIKCIGGDPELVAETIRQATEQSAARAEELAIEERRLRRELAKYHRELSQLSSAAGGGDEIAVARLADLQDQLQDAEHRLLEVAAETERIATAQIDPDSAAAALEEFDAVWEALSPKEQGELLRLLIERIDYDGQEGEIGITFEANEIASLASLNLHEKAPMA